MASSKVRHSRLLTGSRITTPICPQFQIIPADQSVFIGHTTTLFAASPSTSPLHDYHDGIQPSSTKHSLASLTLHIRGLHQPDSSRYPAEERHHKCRQCRCSRRRSERGWRYLVFRADADDVAATHNLEAGRLQARRRPCDAAEQPPGPQDIVDGEPQA